MGRRIKIPTQTDQEVLEFEVEYADIRTGVAEEQDSGAQLTPLLVSDCSRFTQTFCAPSTETYTTERHPTVNKNGTCSRYIVQILKSTQKHNKTNTVKQFFGYVIKNL